MIVVHAAARVLVDPVVRDSRGVPAASRAAVPIAPPRPSGAPVDGSDKPTEAGGAEAPKPAVKRVRKVVVPAAGGDAKGE